MWCPDIVSPQFGMYSSVFQIQWTSCVGSISELMDTNKDTCTRTDLHNHLARSPVSHRLSLGEFVCARHCTRMDWIGTYSIKVNVIAASTHIDVYYQGT